jgi:hypothetical protein
MKLDFDIAQHKPPVMPNGYHAADRAMLLSWLYLVSTVNGGKPPQGYVYNGAADFLLQHGKWYEPMPYPEGMWDGVPKCCFGNSIIAAVKYGLRYVEGFAVANLGIRLHLPVHHAWNVDSSGRLYDSTWKPIGLAYFGVEFSVERADDATWNGDASVLNDYQRGNPLFRQRWNGEPHNKKWPRSERLESIKTGTISPALALEMSHVDDSYVRI